MILICIEHTMSYFTVGKLYELKEKSSTFPGCRLIYELNTTAYKGHLMEKDLCYYETGDRGEITTRFAPLCPVMEIMFETGVENENT